MDPVQDGAADTSDTTSWCVSLAPRPTTGSRSSYLSAEKNENCMDCLINFSDLVAGLVGLGFSLTIKKVGEKSFDVKKKTICRNKKPVNNVLFVTK